MNKMSRIMASLLMGLLLSTQVLAEDQQPDAAVREEYELDSWTSAREINTVEAYEVYLAEYAKGRHAKYAQAAINKLKKSEHSQEPESAGGHPANQNEASATKPAAPQIPAADAVATPKPVPVAAEKAPVAAEKAPVAAETKAVIPVNAPMPSTSIPPVVGEKARVQ